MRFSLLGPRNTTKAIYSGNICTMTTFTTALPTMGGTNSDHSRSFQLVQILFSRVIVWSLHGTESTTSRENGDQTGQGQGQMMKETTCASQRPSAFVMFWNNEGTKEAKRKPRK